MCLLSFYPSFYFEQIHINFVDLACNAVQVLAKICTDEEPQVLAAVAGSKQALERFLREVSKSEGTEDALRAASQLLSD